MSLEARAEAHHVLTYRQNVQLVAQQMKPLFRPTVMSIPCTGEAVNAADLVGTVHSDRSGTNEMRNINNPPTNSRRWLIFPNANKSGQYIQTAEKLQAAMDPTSNYVRAHTAAVSRGMDEIVLGVKRVDGAYVEADGGILGAAVEGKRPNGNKTALPASVVTPAGSTGMTIAKLKEAKERMAQDDFGIYDDEPLYCAISPKQVTDLLTLAEADGQTLNLLDQQQLRDGKPTSLMGLVWVVSNLLPVNASGHRRCPIWAKSNIIEGVWEELNGTMWNDTNADNLPYVRVRAYSDCVRVEDKGVHVIECVEA